MKAVILAAGRGRRLRPLSDNYPKPLTTIGDKTLIEYSIIALGNAGIKSVLVVIGYLGEKIREHLGDDYAGVSIEYVSNNDYLKTNSMCSFYKSKTFADDDLILLECDLLYDYSMIEKIISCPHQDAIVISEIMGTGDEVLVSANQESGVLAIGKTIQKDQIVGEYIGVTRFSRAYLAKFFDFVAEKYFKNQDLNGYYEDYFVDFHESQGFPMHYYLIQDLVWTEIDNEVDLEHAKNNIFPKLEFNML
jgi:choline kinase